MISAARAVLLASVAVGATVAGCAAPREQFYSLVSKAPPPATGMALQTTSLVVEPVTVPVAVERPELVVVDSTGSWRVLEQQRWLEPPADGIRRQLQLALAARLPQRAVLLAGNGAVDTWHLYVQVRRFELTVAQGARLDVHWQLRGPSPEQRLQADASLAIAARDSSYPALVAAQSAAIDALAGEFVAAWPTKP